MRKNFLFSDKQFSKLLEECPRNKESIFSNKIILEDGCWLELSLLEHHPRVRSPSIGDKWEWRVRFWDESNVILGIVYWNSDAKFSPEFARLKKEEYVSCSESELKDFLIKRSTNLGEWLLWNLI